MLSKFGGKNFVDFAQNSVVKGKLMNFLDVRQLMELMKVRNKTLSLKKSLFRTFLK